MREIIKNKSLQIGNEFSKLKTAISEKTTKNILIANEIENQILIDNNIRK